MPTGTGIILPRPGHVPDPYQIYVDRCIVTADSDATTDLYDILINDDEADTDTDIMLFAVPHGCYVMDIGVHVIVAMTDDAEMIVGDQLDSDGWLASDAYEGSDVTVGIKWATQRSVNFLVDNTADYGNIATVSTAAAAYSAYGLNGGKQGIVDSSSTGVLLDQYVILFHQKEAVMEAGTVEFWIKYSLASLNPPFFRDSDLGATGD